jgi:hypothetical protein
LDSALVLNTFVNTVKAEPLAELTALLSELLAGQRVLLDGLRRVEDGLRDLRAEAGGNPLARILPAWTGSIGSEWATVADALEFDAVKALEMTPTAIGLALSAAARSSVVLDALRVEMDAAKTAHNQRLYRVIEVLR